MTQAVMKVAGWLRPRRSQLDEIRSVSLEAIAALRSRLAKLDSWAERPCL